MEEFFKKTNCDRCGGSLEGGRTMSMFNEQVICRACKEAERKRPDYGRAVEADEAAVRAGNRNYRGIGMEDGK